MKKLLLSTFSLAMIATGYSQISITKALYEQYRDTTIEFEVNNASQINVGANAVNGTWDVSNAELGAATVTVVLPYDADLPGADSFPAATHYESVYEIEEDGNLSQTLETTFVKRDNTSEILLGSFGGGFVGTEDTAVIRAVPGLRILTFPFEYLDTLTNDVAVGHPNDDLSATMENYLKYESWGKVKFPGDAAYTNSARLTNIAHNEFTIFTTFQGLRTKMMQISNDTIVDFVGENLKRFTWTRSTTRTLVTLAQTGTVLQDETTTDTSATFTKSTTLAEIRDIALSVNDDQYFTGVNVYPNPTAEKVSFNTSHKVASVEVISSNGSSYFASTGNEVEIQGDKGLYLIKVTLENGASKSFKVVKN